MNKKRAITSDHDGIPYGIRHISPIRSVPPRKKIKNGNTLRKSWNTESQI